jgi:topoisomerase-4 subunit B
VREFCEFRNLVPRGLKLAPEDVWSGVAFVLSVRMQNPQFAGQTKEKLSSRESRRFVSGVVKDAFALWLNQHPEAARRSRSSRSATRRSAPRPRARHAQAHHGGPGAARQARGLHAAGARALRAVPGRGRLRGGRPSRRGTGSFQAVMPLRGKILNTWEVEAGGRLASQEVHDITTALGVDAGSADLSGLRYHKVCILADADSTARTSRRCCARCSCATSARSVLAGPRVRGDAAAVPDRRRQERVLRARRARQGGRPRPHPGRRASAASP